MIQSSDISVVTGFTEHYESSTSSPDWVEVSYWHVPQFLLGFFVFMIMWVLTRFTIELIKRWK